MGRGTERRCTYIRQVRYRVDEDWVEVVEAGTRQQAATSAARAYRDHTDGRGRSPNAVRVVVKPARDD
jgi:hypothetical protein